LNHPLPDPARPAAVYPSIARRLAAMVYEALLVCAILMVAAFLFYGAATHKLEGAARALFQCYLLVILGGYFIWCWRRGRTLAMKAWKLRVVRTDGTAISVPQAALRFVLAFGTVGLGVLGGLALWKGMQQGWFGLAASAITIAWAWLDPDRQFLHDRLARTQLVLVKEPRKPRTTETSD